MQFFFLVSLLILVCNLLVSASFTHADSNLDDQYNNTTPNSISFKVFESDIQDYISYRENDIVNNIFEKHYIEYNELYLQYLNLEYKFIPYGENTNRKQEKVRFYSRIDSITVLNNRALEILVNNGKKEFKILVKYELLLDVPVLNSKKFANEIISKEDLVYKRYDLRKLRKDTEIYVENIENRMVNRNLYVQRPILSNTLQEPYSIYRNDKIRIQYLKNGVRINTIGRAMENGYIGDVINVQYENSKLLAKVISAETVSVAF